VFGELLLLHEAPKAKNSPKQDLLLREANAKKAHFTLGIESSSPVASRASAGEPLFHSFPSLFLHAVSAVLDPGHIPPNHPNQLKFGVYGSMARKYDA